MFAQKNSTVVIVDADLGAANMHTCLGMETPVRSLIDYLSEKVLSLSDCITPTPYSNLYLISGAQDSLDIANPSYSQIKRLIQGTSRIRSRLYYFGFRWRHESSNY